MPGQLIVSLPDWLSQEGPTRFVVDPDLAYPAALKALEAHALKTAKPGETVTLQPSKPDQFWVELAYLLLKEAVTRIVPGHVSRLRFLRRERWALAECPAPDGCAIVGASEDATLAKLQREVSCHKARKAWETGKYKGALKALTGRNA